MGRKGFQGRTVLDAATLGMVVRAREKKAIAAGLGRDNDTFSARTGDDEVEAKWRLKKGILEERLGRAGDGVFGGVS